MKKLIEISHDVGDIVYLKTDSEQRERMVTGITIRPIGITYKLSCGEYDETTHYEIELTNTKDILKTM